MIITVNQNVYVTEDQQEFVHLIIYGTKYIVIVTLKKKIIKKMEVYQNTYLLQTVLTLTQELTKIGVLMIVF